jgi:hypothetical protein
MENKFFTFIRPYLAFIDNGHFFRKPFGWLYAAIAILNLLLPIIILVTAINGGVFNAPGKMIFAFILIWLVIAFVSWLGFQLWWDRRERVMFSSAEEDDFVATPVFSHFIQTLGEYAGTYIGVVGGLSALIMTIFLGDESYMLSRQLGLGFMQSGIIGIITMPILGFLIVVIARFWAEMFRALASIANNTRRL